MKYIPELSFTWSRDPIDTRLGVMVGSDYDFIRPVNSTDWVRCLRFSLNVGLLCANLRVGLVCYVR